MPTKQGNGGHGQENYDPATGRYVGNETSNNLEKYHAGSGFPSAELEKQLLNGDFGQDFVDYYNKADDDTKQEILEYVHSQFDEANTEEKMKQNFNYLSRSEYEDMQNKALQNSSLTYDERDAVRNYTGTGKTSFYLNTAARFGYDEMRRQVMQNEGYDPENSPGDYLNRDNVEKFLAAMEKGTHDYKLEKDTRVNRYVGTGPLISWFKNTGVLDGLPTESNRGFHEHLAPGFDMQDLANRLSNLVGTVMPKDGSYMSVSMCPDLSHMKQKRGTNAKPVLMKIDLPKGQGVYISDNHYESEGMLPSDIDLYIKDVKLENEYNSKNGITTPRVVIYYGVK